MKSLIKKIINPLELIRAYQFHKDASNHIKASKDLELMLYSKIINNDMLHYGYFEDVDVDPETISIKDLENAQMKYVELIVEQILDKKNNVLDVGCGMGGLSKILFDRGMKVHSLTPDDNQKKYIEKHYPELMVHHMKFEDFSSDKQFTTIINSESLQYIDLDTAFNCASKLLSNNGKWIITDYFRINNNGINKSGHMHHDFLTRVKKNGWKITYENDMTLNSLPTLKYAITFINRFIKPLAFFGNEKLKHKQGWLFYLTNELRNNMSKKFEKELAALDPEKFIKEKKYMLYVIEKTG